MSPNGAKTRWIWCGDRTLRANTEIKPPRSNPASNPAIKACELYRRAASNGYVRALHRAPALLRALPQLPRDTCALALCSLPSDWSSHFGSSARC
eukprot:4347076-Prymnesium_polylepis.1